MSERDGRHSINTLNVPHSDGFLSTEDYDMIHASVLTQCDGLDGLQDGVILDPYQCHPNLTTLLCPKSSEDDRPATQCLHQAQINTMNRIYQNWTTDEGQWLFPSYLPGSEAGANNRVTGRTAGPAPDFFE